MASLCMEVATPCQAPLMVYCSAKPRLSMFLLVLVYYVVMDLPRGVVETEFHKGLLRVGDRTHWVRPGHEMVSVRKGEDVLVFTFKQKG